MSDIFLFNYNITAIVKRFFKECRVNLKEYGKQLPPTILITVDHNHYSRIVVEIGYDWLHKKITESIYNEYKVPIAIMIFSTDRGNWPEDNINDFEKTSEGEIIMRFQSHTGLFGDNGFEHT